MNKKYVPIAPSLVLQSFSVPLHRCMNPLQLSEGGSHESSRGVCILLSSSYAFATRDLPHVQFCSFVRTAYFKFLVLWSESMYHIFENSGGNNNKYLEGVREKKILTLTAFCMSMFGVCIYTYMYVHTRYCT